MRYPVELWLCWIFAVITLLTHNDATAYIGTALILSYLSRSRNGVLLDVEVGT